jgi:hypothetical protein
MTDKSWADLARSTREALRLLGYDIAPQCLPGEPGECGGSFAQHAGAHLATIMAVSRHHLAHLGPSFQVMIDEIYDHASREIDCGEIHLPGKDP